MTNDQFALTMIQELSELKYGYMDTILSCYEYVKHKYSADHMGTKEDVIYKVKKVMDHFSEKSTLMSDELPE
jgi:hypothetical protein